MRLFDVPMIKNHSYMMYLKNVTTPDRLSDLNWIFTKIKILLFFANFLTKFLKDLLTKQAKIVIFSVFWSHFWICSRRHHIIICSLFWSVIIGCSSPRNLGVHVLNTPFYGNSNFLTTCQLPHLLFKLSKPWMWAYLSFHRKAYLRHAFLSFSAMNNLW